MEARARGAVHTKEGKLSLSSKVWFSNSSVHLGHLVGLFKCRWLAPATELPQFIIQMVWAKLENFHFSYVLRFMRRTSQITVDEEIEPGESE